MLATTDNSHSAITASYEPYPEHTLPIFNSHQDKLPHEHTPLLSRIISLAVANLLTSPSESSLFFSQETYLPTQIQSLSYNRVQELLFTYLLQLFHIMCQLRLSTVDILTGLIYFQRLVLVNNKQFRLTLATFNTAFVVCIILGHKYNSDSPYTNACLAHSFGVPLEMINDSEKYVLSLLDYQLYVEQKEYIAMESFFQEHCTNF